MQRSIWKVLSTLMFIVMLLIFMNWWWWQIWAYISMYSEVAPKFIVDTSKYYPSVTDYNYICTCKCQICCVDPKFPFLCHFRYFYVLSTFLCFDYLQSYAILSTLLCYLLLTPNTLFCATIRVLTIWCKRGFGCKWVPCVRCRTWFGCKWGYFSWLWF